METTKLGHGFCSGSIVWIGTSPSETPPQPIMMSLSPPGQHHRTLCGIPKSKPQFFALRKPVYWWLTTVVALNRDEERNTLLKLYLIEWFRFHNYRYITLRRIIPLNIVNIRRYYYIIQKKTFAWCVWYSIHLKCEVNISVVDVWWKQFVPFLLRTQVISFHLPLSFFGPA